MINITFLFWVDIMAIEVNLTINDNRESQWLKLIGQIITGASIIIVAYISTPKSVTTQEIASKQSAAVEKPVSRPSGTVQQDAPNASNPPTGTPAIPISPSIVAPGPVKLLTVTGDSIFPPCKSQPGIFGIGAECNESTAARTNVCVTIPATAVVDTVKLYTKFLDESEDLSKSPAVKPNTDTSRSKFEGERFSVLGKDGKTQDVCWPFAHWSSHRSRIARIVVDYH